MLKPQHSSGFGRLSQFTRSVVRSKTDRVARQLSNLLHCERSHQPGIDST